MKAIIIDTSTEKSAVLFVEEGKIVAKKALPTGFQSSRSLIEALNIDFEGVELIGVTTGPGLMTGIRVGIAAAQGLSLGLGVPLVGISSLEGYCVEEGQIAVIDAKVRGAYVQKWGEEPKFCSFEDLPAFLEGASAIVGPNLARIDFPHKIEREPCYERIVKMVFEKLTSQDFSLRAIYLN